MNLSLPVLFRLDRWFGRKTLFFSALFEKYFINFWIVGYILAPCNRNQKFSLPIALGLCNREESYEVGSVLAYVYLSISAYRSRRLRQ